MITREFKLYLNAGVGVAPVINANQFDQSEEWVFTLLQSDGTVYTPSTGAIIGLKQDGTTILNAGTVNSDGQVVITETEQMTAVPGSNLFELMIDGNTHGTANFVVFVERRPGDIDNPSESDISLFQEAITAAGNVTQFQADIAELKSDVDDLEEADTSLASQIAQETSARTQQDAVLQAEIDQIIAPSGEAPSAAEVQNARIGVDGTTYDTLGNAIRTQVSDLKNALEAINWGISESYVFVVNNNKYIENGALINGTVTNSLRASTDIIDVFSDTILVFPKYGYSISVGARKGTAWEKLATNITSATEFNLSEYSAFFMTASNDTAIRHTDNADIYIPVIENVLDLSKSTNEIKNTVDYIAPIVAPIKTNIELANGTISNPNNANAIRTSIKIPCKNGDVVTLYPVRPSTNGYYYAYGYRIYDTNGSTVVNVSDATADGNTVYINHVNAASIEFFWFETDGTNYIALRAYTYGYTPYVLVTDGTSLSETFHEPENLYHKYGSDSVHYTISAQYTLTYGDAHFMAVIPCAPNTKYIVKISKAVTKHPRFRIAWSEMYPNKAGLPVYDCVSKDNDMTDAYTTGATARYLLVYLGFTMATETPSQFISITGYDLHVDPYARQIIKSNSDIYRQKAEVLRLKKTGDETYGECDAKFMFMTDIHAEVSRLKDATRRYKEWGNSYISAVLNGGDTVYQKLPDGLDWYYDQIDTLDIPVLPTVGNHDAWSALSVLETDPVVVYNEIIAPIVASTGIVQPANAATNGYNYYYKDFNNTVRLVVLDCMYWNATQLSWLESVLADAKTNGLHVIALTHCAFPWADMETVDCSWSKAGMLGGYSSQAVLSDPSRTNIQAAQAVKDFIDSGGTFICWLTGHQHGDDVHILPNYDNQFVVTLGSFAQRASMLQKSDVVTDYNYNCLTYITIDTFLKTIKFMRVGADIDMYGVKHNFLSIKYDESKLISAN